MSALISPSMTFNTILKNKENYSLKGYHIHRKLNQNLLLNTLVHHRFSFVVTISFPHTFNLNNDLFHYTLEGKNNIQFLITLHCTNSGITAVQAVPLINGSQLLYNALALLKLNSALRNEKDNNILSLGLSITT